MKKMFATLLALSLFSLGGVSAFADSATVNTPKSEKGGEVHPSYGGYKSTRVATASETIVCSGRCLLAEILRGTGAATSFMTVRDTSVADASGAQMLPKWRFSTLDTDVVRPLIQRPIRTTKGISITLSSVSAQEEVTVLYLDDL